MSVKVKICGITNSDDLACAVEAGADIIGFILAESPRRILPEKCRELRALIPAGVKAAGVFVDEAEETVASIAEECRLDFVQLHGSESPGYCRRFGSKGIKAFRVKNIADLAVMKPYTRGLYLLDSFVPGVAGGTGKTFDPEIAIKAKTFGNIIVAGGLNPGNVQDIIRKVRPWGVDVSSGVEKNKGIKDHSLVREFISKVKELQ